MRWTHRHYHLWPPPHLLGWGSNVFTYPTEQAHCPLPTGMLPPGPHKARLLWTASGMWGTPVFNDKKSGWCSCCSPSRVSEPYAEVSLPSAPGSPPWRGRGRRRSRFISTRSSSSWSYGSRTKRTEKEIDKFPEIFNTHGFLLWAVNKIDCLFFSKTKQNKNKKLSMSSSDNLVTDSSNWQVLQNLIIEKNLWLISKQISSTVVFLQTNSSNLPKMFQKKS